MNLRSKIWQPFAILSGGIFAAMLALSPPGVEARPEWLGGNGATDVPMHDLSSRYQFLSADLEPENGEVSIELVNRMDAAITYQLVGDTQARRLLPSEGVTLTSVEPPTTLNIYRKDGGLLSAIAEETDDPSKVQIMVNPTDELEGDERAIWINEDGEVFVN